MKPMRLQLVEHAVVHFYHMAEVGVTLEDALQPAFWSFVAPKLTPGSRITLDAGDLSWTATLVVRSAGRVDAQVSVLSHVEFEDAIDPAGEPEAPFEVKFRGPRKFGVIRKEDGAVVKEDIATKDEARQWLKNHMAAQAR